MPRAYMLGMVMMYSGGLREREMERGSREMLTAIFGPSEKGDAVLAFHGGGDAITKKF